VWYLKKKIKERIKKKVLEMKGKKERREYGYGKKCGFYFIFCN
jgi:hypothetical protein